jgi:hypothetical protein
VIPRLDILAAAELAGDSRQGMTDALIKMCHDEVEADAAVYDWSQDVEADIGEPVWPTRPMSGTAFTDRWSLKRHATQRNRVLAGIDRDTLRPLSLAEVAHRQQIVERMHAKGADTQVDGAMSELRAVIYECAMVAPFAALATVGWFALNIP